MTRFRTSTLGLLALVAALVLAPAVEAGRGGNGGGKPGDGGGEPPPAAPAIAYWDKDTGDIVVVDADGSNATIIVPNAGTLIAPVFSPDGTRIAFQGAVSGAGIYVVNLDGTGLERIRATTLTTGRVAWSPVADAAGKHRIAFADIPEGGEWTDLYLVDEDGQNLVRLTSTTAVGEGSPTWRGDGSELAYVAKWNDASTQTLCHDLLLRDMGTGTESSLVYGSGSELDGARLTSPDWSRSGDAIAVAADAGEGYTTLWVVDAACLEDPVQFLATHSDTPSWAPDDSQVVCYVTTSRRKDQGLYVATPDGSDEQRITGSEALNPDWMR